MRGIVFATAAVSTLIIAACGQPSGASDASPKTATTPSEVRNEAVADEPAAVDFAAARSGKYTTDPKHHHLLFKYNHQGYSTSIVRWRDWTGELDWNAENPEASSIIVAINADKVDSGVDEFDGHLKGERFFDTPANPTVMFKSTSLSRTGPNTGKMAGDLTIKGVTKPLTLDVSINKAAFEERAGVYKLGFSGKGVVKRSEFGMDYAIPFVGDEVTIVVEAEFLSPKAE